jgi:hypothetical protein
MTRQNGESLVMRLCRCVFQHGRLLLIALSLTGMLTGVAPVTAQESVQQILQQIGPEQPKGSETGLVMTTVRDKNI